MKRVVVLTVCGAIALFSCVSSVDALPQFKKEFGDKYVEGSGSASFEEAVKKQGCNVCHVKGQKKDVRNAYGEELAKLIPGDASARIKEAADKDAEKATVNKELAEAFKKVEAMKSPSGETYGELLKGHSLPVAAE